MKKRFFALIAEESTCRKLENQITSLCIKYIQTQDFFTLFDHSSREKITHIVIDLAMISNKQLLEVFNRFPGIQILVLSNKLSYKQIKSLFKIGVKGLMSTKDSFNYFKNDFRLLEKHGAFISPLFAVEITNHFSKKQYSELDRLPKRRAQIARELLKGLTYKEVAERNYISVETVRDHVKKIYHDLNVHSRAELMNYCKS
jgi:DNA-binding NarL/FixJ family response regulator